MAKGTTNTGRIAENRKARHEYEIVEKIEAGCQRRMFPPLVKILYQLQLEVSPIVTVHLDVVGASVQALLGNG